MESLVTYHSVLQTEHVGRRDAGLEQTAMTRFTRPQKLTSPCRQTTPSIEATGLHRTRVTSRQAHVTKSEVTHFKCRAGVMMWLL